MGFNGLCGTLALDVLPRSSINPIQYVPTSQAVQLSLLFPLSLLRCGAVRLSYDCSMTVLCLWYAR